MGTISEVVETLRAGFQQNEETRLLLKRKREFEGTTHVLQWENVERPAKISRVRIENFKEFYSFNLLGRTLVEASRPGVKIRHIDHSPYFQVQKVVVISEEISFRTSEKKETRSTKRSTFKDRRQAVIQERRETSQSPPPPC